MKLKSVIVLVVALFSVISCSSLQTVAGGKQIDKRLIGTWTGSEKDQQISGVQKSWEMDRKADGTFELDFRFTQNGQITNTVETGNWWIENEKFHEKHIESGNTDIYSYQVLGKNQVKFISESISIDMNTDTYEFIDTRKVASKGLKDGSSIENAIKVKSVSEEYAYIRSNCNQCTFVRQSLIQVKGKPYDLLEVTKPDGTTAKYYFDISSFFGKW